MEADIRAAKAMADVVLVSQHWGIHFVRAVIADYQRDVARAAIAAGADAIFGGHAHILKGCELIDGKPVFYSLCEFRHRPAHGRGTRAVEKLQRNPRAGGGMGAGL